MINVVQHAHHDTYAHHITHHDTHAQPDPTQRVLPTECSTWPKANVSFEQSEVIMVVAPFVLCLSLWVLVQGEEGLPWVHPYMLGRGFDLSTINLWDYSAGADHKDVFSIGPNLFVCAERDKDCTKTSEVRGRPLACRLLLLALTHPFTGHVGIHTNAHHRCQVNRHKHALTTTLTMVLTDSDADTDHDNHSTNNSDAVNDNTDNTRHRRMASRRKGHAHCDN